MKRSGAKSLKLQNIFLVQEIAPYFILVGRETWRQDSSVKQYLAEEISVKFGQWEKDKVTSGVVPGGDQTHRSQSRWCCSLQLWGEIFLYIYIRIFKSKPSKLNWSVLIPCLALHYPQINCPQEFSGISHFHYLILYNFLSRFSSSKRSTLENLLQQHTAVL